MVWKLAKTQATAEKSTSKLSECEQHKKTEGERRKNAVMKCYGNKDILINAIILTYKIIKQITKFRFFNVNTVAMARGFIKAQNSKDVH